MRIIVVSDSHRHFSALAAVAERHMDETNRLLFLGDGLEDLQNLSLLYPNLSVCAVRGNCDFMGDAPLTGILEADGKRIFYTHGHQYFVKRGTGTLEAMARRQHADIAVYGHTHVPYEGYRDGLYLLCPGSIGSPQTGRPAYGIIDITPAGIVTHLCHL